MLYIYRASAGSGKTHLLTGFFIRLLFRRDLMPESLDRPAMFDEILAVTFTKKATAEMKERIVGELHRLATQPEKSPYWAEVNPGGSLSPHSVSEKAHALLGRILSDYSSFQVSTIDAFFQRIVRAFARELNVQGNYEVELDADRVLDAAVAQLLTDLDTQGNGTLMGWLVEFAQSRIEAGEGWDVKRELRSLAGQLTTERYRQHADSIEAFTHDKKRMHRYVDGLKRTVRSFQDDLKRLGAEGAAIMERAELQPEHFKHGASAPVARFAKWATGDTKQPPMRFLQWAEDIQQGIKPTTPIDDATAAALQDVMRRIVAHFDSRWCDYLTALAILPNIYQLGLLADIDRCARRFCAEQGIMLLASTTELLRRLIDTGDAPFVYEKTGTRLKTYMIDEFQDTSGMQWDSFRPLLEDSLGTGYPNLIVGDVKQSIYRWRGSDWGLLQTGLSTFRPEHHVRGKEVEPLCVNHRSARTIVEFNNAFFDRAAATLGLSDVYADVRQDVSPRRRDDAEGLVAVCTVGGSRVDEQQAAAMAALPDVVIRLQQAGFRACDIAILCRSGHLCTLAAETLLAYRKAHPNSPYTFDIISNEALTLAARPIVQTVIALMQYLQNPTSRRLRAVAACNLYRRGDRSLTEAIARPLPDGLRTLAHRPLYEMLEGLIALAEAERDPADAAQDTPFLQALRDVVMNFVSRKSPDLSTFLEWWDTYGEKQTIATPDAQDAIHIMTIHKAKGLAWPAVILPHAAWEIDLKFHRSSLLWVEAEVDDTPDAPTSIMLPVVPKKALEDTRFADQYAAERARTRIDNLNIAYVAFTRPREALVIMVPQSATTEMGQETKPPKADDGENKAYSVDRLVADCLTAHPNGPGQAQAFRPEPLTPGDALPPPDAPDGNATPDDEAPRLYVLGSWTRSADAQQAPQPQAATAPATPTDATARRAGLPRLSLRRSEALAHHAAAERGTRMHDALAHVTTLADVADPELRSRLAHPDVAPWFAEGLTVLNEHTILTPDGKAYRPDRIVRDAQGRVTVIDYKTGHPAPAHSEQVGRYMALLLEMGYADVVGYIWYLEPHKVVSCSAPRSDRGDRQPT